MQAGLVPVVIEFHEPGETVNFLPSTEYAFPCFSEHHFQPFIEKIEAHKVNDPGRVMGYIPGILKGIPFLESPPGLHRIEVFDESAIRIPGPDEPGLRVE